MKMHVRVFNLSKKEFFNPETIEGWETLRQIATGGKGGKGTVTLTALGLLLAAVDPNDDEFGSKHHFFLGRWAGDRIALVPYEAAQEALPFATDNADILYWLTRPKNEAEEMVKQWENKAKKGKLDQIGLGRLERLKQALATEETYVDVTEEVTSLCWVLARVGMDPEQKVMIQKQQEAAVEQKKQQMIEGVQLVSQSMPGKGVTIGIPKIVLDKVAMKSPYWNWKPVSFDFKIPKTDVGYNYTLGPILMESTYKPFCKGFWGGYFSGPVYNMATDKVEPEGYEVATVQLDSLAAVPATLENTLGNLTPALEAIAVGEQKAEIKKAKYKKAVEGIKPKKTVKTLGNKYAIPGCNDPKCIDCFPEGEKSALFVKGFWGDNFGKKDEPVTATVGTMAPAKTYTFTIGGKEYKGITKTADGNYMIPEETTDEP